MKRLTTALCCICLMIAGVGLAFYDGDTHKYNEIMASEANQLMWNVPKGKVLPLDLQLDLEKRQLGESPKDSINIIDSIRWVEKIRWKTRYKSVADRTTAREVGQHLAAVTPDSLSENPATTCTLDREEQPNEIVGTSKVPSIQLTVDGNVVYSTDENHSTEGGQ